MEQLDQLFATVPFGVLVVDAAGQAVYVNRSYRARWGRELDLGVPVPEQILRSQIRAMDGHLLSRDEIPIVRALSGATVEETIFRVVGTERRWTHVLATPTLDESARVTGALLILEDVTRQHEGSRQVEAILRQMSTGVIVLDPAGRIRMTNPSADRLFGDVDRTRPITKVIGAAVLYDADTGQPVTPASSPVARTLRGEEVPSFTIRAHHNGRDAFYHGSGVPLREPDGSRSGALLLVREVSAEVEHRREEQERENVQRVLASLTPRERDVLREMAAGHGNREIATRLGIAYATVRAHVRRLLGKLDVRSRLEAVARARLHGDHPVE